MLPHHHHAQPRSLSPPNGRPFSSGPSFGGTSSASPPHPPPPTPSSTTSQAHSPPIVQKFAENNLFASHLKQLSDHFAKNGGGGGQNGVGQIGQLPIFESLQFKALMNEAMIQQPHFRRSMDFEDADEPPLSRRGSLTPPLRPLDLEMPRLIPNSGGGSSRKNNQAGADMDQGEISDCEDVSQRSHSNENLNEDPMNLVETSWEVSSLNEEPPPPTASNNKMFNPQTAVIKN